ncbi:MAG: DUF2062 domain-containing protein, partial [Bacteroidetes bacterium]|nr:DUF2062 domain-containing protein [Bacteroidota bacterium]
LGHVITDVSAYTDNIIIINDGSTDTTESLLGSFPSVEKISYTKNKGKGWALRQGFKRAIESGYEYAITFDSDGQHFAKDLPFFIEKLEAGGPAIIMGARNLDEENMPGKNSFGNRFSNFWFWVETGIRCPDTQTGFRLYPVGLMKGMKFFTRKYEFEIEVVVRSVWKGIKLEWIPISVYYAPKETRITHFRPFKDFFRISILNTILVLIAFLYIKPRDFFRNLFKKSIKETLRENFSNPDEADSIKAFSVGFGIFMGIIPIWGFQLLAAIALAIVLRLNKALVVIAANISVPPMIPILIFLSYKMGGIWTRKNTVVAFSKSLSLEMIRINFVQYILGSITLAILAGIVLGLLTFILLKFFKRKANIAS